MKIVISDDLLRMLVAFRDNRDADLKNERRAQRELRAAGRIEQKENRALARTVVAFARDFARTGLVPRGGLEIFRSPSGRTTSTVRVQRDGKLSVTHGSYLRAGLWAGRRARAFENAPRAVLRAAAAAVSGGEVWNDIVRAIESDAFAVKRRSYSAR